jgi:hypothetical protein
MCLRWFKCQYDLLDNLSNIWSRWLFGCTSFVRVEWQPKDAGASFCLTDPSIPPLLWGPIAQVRLQRLARIFFEIPKKRWSEIFCKKMGKFSYSRLRGILLDFHMKGGQADFLGSCWIFPIEVPGWKLDHGCCDAIDRKRAFPELPANRTYRRHGPNDANDPEPKSQMRPIQSEALNIGH